MKPKKGMRIAAILLTIVIALSCCLGIVYKQYKENTEFAYRALDNAFSNKNTHEEQIADLEWALELKFISPKLSMKIYSKLVMLCKREQEYSKIIESAVSAIYIADELDEPYYAAWNYINLADVFMKMYDYEKAEFLIEESLCYDIKEPEQKRWIKETAYIYMAELKSRCGKTKEAEKYLKSSMNYIAESDNDYDELIIKRKIIWARTYWYKKEYEKTNAILKDIVEKDIAGMEAKGEVINESIITPLKEIQAKLEIVAGNLKKSEEMCDGTLKFQQNQGNYAYCLGFLKEIAPMYAQRDLTAYNKYNLKTIEIYSIFMDRQKELSADYIFSIYGTKYAKYKDKADNAMSIMIVSIVIMFALTLIVLLLQSRRQSITDSLTNAYNRRYFEKIYNKYIRKNKKFAVIMMDVDYFKSVNDTYGHDFGDLVLLQLCKNFNENKSREFKLFRMGGEEFCVLYRCGKLENAVELAEKLRFNTQEIEWGKDRNVTISVGLSFSGQAEDLYKLADKNLYNSKNSGRNKVTYTP